MYVNSMIDKIEMKKKTFIKIELKMNNLYVKSKSWRLIYSDLP